MEKSSRLRLLLKIKTIHTNCSTAVKRQVIPGVWSTNRKCFVSYDERHVRVRTAKRLFDTKKKKKKFDVKERIKIHSRRPNFPIW